MEHFTWKVTDARAHAYFQLLGITILYWDHFITISVEVRYIWTRPKTQSTLWFLLNRYLAFFGTIPVAVMTLVTLPSENSCLAFTTYRQLLIIANVLLVSGLLTLRIYALYECNIRVIWVLIPIGIVLIGVCCWSMMGQVQTPTMGVGGIGGCHSAISRSSAIRLAASWEALFVYDSILIGLTLYKTCKWSAVKVKGKMSLVQLLLRDGVMYFVVISLANFANILTFFLAQPLLRGCLSTFSSSVSVTMLSRLVLNLNEWAEEANIISRRDTGTLSLDTIEFLDGADEQNPSSYAYVP